MRGRLRNRCEQLSWNMSPTNNKQHFLKIYLMQLQIQTNQNVGKYKCGFSPDRFTRMPDSSFETNPTSVILNTQKSVRIFNDEISKSRKLHM